METQALMVEFIFLQQNPAETPSQRGFSIKDAPPSACCGNTGTPLIQYFVFFVSENPESIIFTTNNLT